MKFFKNNVSINENLLRKHCQERRKFIKKNIVIRDENLLRKITLGKIDFCKIRIHKNYKKHLSKNVDNDILKPNELQKSFYNNN